MFICRGDHRPVSLLAERVTDVLTSEVQGTFAAAAANCGSLSKILLRHLRFLMSSQCLPTVTQKLENGQIRNEKHQ